jgi:pimeloyl-ACP methyl ester carboxylesterase
VTSRSQPDFFDVAVKGGALRVGRWGAGPRLVLGIHGVTASSMSLVPVARHLGDGFTLLAPDLRGRGASAHLPGPFGMAAHAADCAAVLDHAAGGGPVTVVGESMGGFVGVVLAAARPDLVERVVLVDGGLPLPVPDGVDVDALIDAVLGPAVARLRQTFASPEAYLDFWRAHPALQDDWSDDIEAYLRYDLTGEEPMLRSRVSEVAVRADGAENLTTPDLISSSLRAVACPVTMLRATRGLLDQVPPLYPEDVVSPWRAVVAQFADEIVDDTNHYTIAFGDRGAKTVAEHVGR